MARVVESNSIAKPARPVVSRLACDFFTSGRGIDGATRIGANPGASNCTASTPRFARHQPRTVIIPLRALESVVDEHGHVHPSEGWTETIVSPARPVRSVDGFLTGWHEPEASHLLMLEAVAGRELLEASYAASLDEGYLWHEFGDMHLILP